MTDEQQIIQLYKDMYTAMIGKDQAELERVHDDSFVLVHMTGILGFKYHAKNYVQSSAEIKCE